MSTVTKSRKSNKPVDSTLPYDVPGRPTVAEVRKALLGLGVSGIVHRLTLEAWENSTWGDCYGSLTVKELEQRAYEAAAAALMNATQPAPVVTPAPVEEPTPTPPPARKARFVPTREDEQFRAETNPSRDFGYFVTGRVAPFRQARRPTIGTAPSDRCREDNAECMESHGSFVGHPA